MLLHVWKKCQHLPQIFEISAPGSEVFLQFQFIQNQILYTTFICDLRSKT